MIVIYALVAMGCALILCGIALIIFREHASPISTTPLVFTPTGVVKLHTKSTGIVLVVVGAFLLLAAIGAEKLLLPSPEARSFVTSTH